MKILAIEDDPYFQELLREVLGLHGYTLTIACNLFKGLTELYEQHFDLILLDLCLPDSRPNYSETVKTVVRVAHGTPVIVVTSMTPIVGKICLESGATSYIQKGITTLREVLDQAKVQDLLLQIRQGGGGGQLNATG